MNNPRTPKTNRYHPCWKGVRPKQWHKQLEGHRCHSQSPSGHGHGPLKRKAYDDCQKNPNSSGSSDHGTFKTTVGEQRSHRESPNISGESKGFAKLPPEKQNISPEKRLTLFPMEVDWGFQKEGLPQEGLPQSFSFQIEGARAEPHAALGSQAPWDI